MASSSHRCGLLLLNGTTDEGKAALAGKKSFDLKQIKIMLRQMMDDAWAIAQQIKPDMVIYHPKPLAGYHTVQRS